MHHSLALALEILPLLRANTLRGLIRTSGYYAFRSGRTAADVGHALHLIGAACVLARVPVAPVHFVEDVQDEWRRIFTVAAADSDHADVWPLIYATSRLHAYSESDFERVALMVRTQLTRYALTGQAPLGLWRLVVEQALPRAVARYAQAIALDQSAKPHPAWPTLTTTRAVAGRPASIQTESFVGGTQTASSLPNH